MGNPAAIISVSGRTFQGCCLRWCMQRTESISLKILSISKPGGNYLLESKRLRESAAALAAAKVQL